MQQPKVYSVSDHDISPSLIDPDALLVLQKLREAGHTAYLVGGSVRDLLLKRVPKDFDISTSAQPEEIKDIFHRQCLLIGRRFRLAHIRFGHKVIEVATFRSGENEDELIIRDNQWGSPEEDARRRDFTINGLFYEPSQHVILDYVGGWEDIHNNILKSIGNPEVRFKQDPVRMIRLLKFRARFGFEIAHDARKALVKCRQEIFKSSPARILEEILRMLESGAASPFFSLLAESGLLSLLYPSLNDYIKSPAGKEWYYYLASADQLNLTRGKNPLDRSLLMACMLFPLLKYGLQTEYVDQGKIPHLGEVMMATSITTQRFEKDAFAIFPRRLNAIMHGILSMQYRLTPLSGKIHHHPKIFRQKDFPLALVLLKIRAIVDKGLIETYTEWKALYRQFLRQTERRGHHPHHNNPSIHSNSRRDIEHVSNS